MSSRMSSPVGPRLPDLATLNRRLSALDVEEREIDMPVEGDLSEVSTLAVGRKDGATDQVTGLSSPVDTSGWTTPATATSTPPGVGAARLVRTDSQVMQVRKETKTKVATYPRKGYQTTTRFFYEEIDSHWTAALIVVCFFVAGMVDSVSYQTFSVFTSLQTGNTIFIALRLSSQPANRQPFVYIKSLISILSYCIGALFFNILHRAPTDISNPKPRLHRWTLVTSFIIQSSLLLISAALAQSGWVSTEPFKSTTFSSGSSRNPEARDNYLDLIPIAFLAFEAAGQVCLSRVLVVSDLPTIVISTLYHDLMGDALSWRQLWKTRESNWHFVEGQKRQIRRFLCIVALFSGAIGGGFVYAGPGGIAAALWIAAGTKVIVGLAWCMWKRKIVTETVVTRHPPKDTK